MTHLKTIIFPILILFFLNICGQETEKEYRKLKKVTGYQLVLNNDTVKPFYISENPITNKEYLTYLCWIADVYQYVPRILLNAFPNLNENQIDSLVQTGFTPIQIRTLVERDYFVKQYMFNPKYINYPVLGLTWGQSMNFLNWLSDRYNEYTLIDKGYHHLSRGQINEYSFNTESYLFDNYEGIVRKLIWDTVINQERSVKWKDRILIPSFRLPSKKEIRITHKNINHSLKEYKSNKFLKYWSKYYIDINKYQIILRIVENNFLLFSYNKNESTRPEYYKTLSIKSEIVLDQLYNKKEKSILKIFSDLGQDIISIQNQKNQILNDSLGHMPFILIGEANLNPIFIKRIDYLNKGTKYMKKKKSYSIFRYALSGIKK